MTHYLIEFRFFGGAKKEIKKLVYSLDDKFHLRRTRRHIPHITLAGPFFTSQEKKLISDFKEICSQQPVMEFEINGFGTFDSTRVVYLDIDPDEKLKFFKRSSQRN